MTMPATDAADGGRDSVSSILEIVWQHHMFSRPRIENRTDGAAECNVLSPRLHLQTAPAPIKEDRAFQAWPLAIPRLCQTVPGNEQIVGPLDPKHLHPDQHRRDDDRMHAVYPNAVHTLKPGQCIALFVYEARIRADLRDRSA